MPSLRLVVHEGRHAVCQVDPDRGVPAWVLGRPFFAVVATAGELSAIVPQERVPEGVKAERGWRLLSLAGPFPFEATGILASVLQPLAAAGVGILALSTFDTDVVLVKEERLGDAVAALREAGHTVDAGP